MHKVLLIDANSIGFSAHRMNRLTAGGIETQAVFGFLKSIRNLMQMYPGYEPICLWDGRSWRKDVNAEYKANRDSNPKIAAEREGYKAQKPYITEALSLLGVKQMFSPNMEADDLAAITVDKLSGKAEIVLVTGDRDWLQLVDDNIIWFDPIRDRTVNIHTFEEETGYQTPEAFTEGKALQGDVSDNIKGVGGIGEKGAEELLRTYGSVSNFLSATFASTAKIPKKLMDFHTNAINGHEKFAENVKLMNLRTPLRPKPKNLKLTVGEFNKDKFEEFCAQLAFHSILRDFDNWIEIFKR